MKIIKIFQLRCDEEVKERLRWFTGEVLGIERLMTLDQITVPEEGGLDVQIREFIESLGVRCVSPEEWNRLDRRRNVCVVRRLFEYTDDDRAAAEWLWVASTSEISLDGERRVGADGVTCVTNASIARTSRCVGLFLDRFAVRDDLRSEIDSASPPLRGFCFREVRIESWAARGQLRAAFW